MVCHFHLMVEETPPYRQGTDYILYPKPDAEGYVGQCRHCTKKLKNRSSLLYQHPKFCTKFLTASSQGGRGLMDRFLTQRRKDPKLREITRMLCENAIPINVSQTRTFQDNKGSN